MHQGKNMPTQFVPRARPSRIKTIADWSLVVAQHVMVLLAISLATILLLKAELSLAADSGASLTAYPQLLGLPL